MLLTAKNNNSSLVLSGEILWSEKTPFQSLEIFRDEQRGLVLLLDRDAQIAEIDFFRYQESMVHPALWLHPSPKNILILGGGDGLFQDDLWAYPSLQRVDWVEIDERVYPIFKQFCAPLIRELSPDILNIRIQDGFSWICQTNQRYDAIFLDLVDPRADCPLTRDLFLPETLHRLALLLTQPGVLVFQTGDGGLQDPLGALLQNEWSWVAAYSVPTSLQKQSFLMCGNFPLTQERFYQTIKIKNKNKAHRFLDPERFILDSWTEGVIQKDHS